MLISSFQAAVIPETPAHRMADLVHCEQSAHHAPLRRVTKGSRLRDVPLGRYHAAQQSDWGGTVARLASPTLALLHVVHFCSRRTTGPQRPLASPDSPSPKASLVETGASIQALSCFDVANHCEM